MLQVQAIYSLLGIDVKGYTKRAQDGAAGLVMVGGIRFMQAALKKIPTFNPPSGGIASDYSTGFVAGAFKAVADATKAYTKKAHLPNIEVPDLDILLTDVQARALTTIKEEQRARLKEVRHERKHGIIKLSTIKGEVIEKPIIAGTYRGKPITKEGLAKERRLYVKRAKRLATREYRRYLQEQIKDVIKRSKAKYPTPEEEQFTGLLKKRVRIIHKTGGRTLRIKVNPYYHGGGTKVLRTPISGKKFATNTNNIFVSAGNRFGFNFSINIDYLTLQDVSVGRSKSAPWQAFEAGRKAIHEYLSQTPNIRAVLPALGDFINVESRLIVKGSQVKRDTSSITKPAGLIEKGDVQKVNLQPADPLLKKFISRLKRERYKTRAGIESGG